MKRSAKITVLSVLTVICLTFLLAVFCGCDFGSSYVFEGIRYSIDVKNHAARVRQFYAHGDDNSPMVCEIPSSVEYRGVVYPVVGIIGENIFMSGYISIVSDGTIKDLIVPETVTSINLGMYTSNSLSTLQHIIVHPDNPAYTSINGVLYTKDCSELVYCPQSAYGTLTLPKELTAVNEDTTLNFNRFADVIVEEGNALYKSEDGATYTLDGKELVHYSKSGTNDTFTLPKEVNKISCSLYNQNLKSIEVEQGNFNFKSIDGVLYSYYGTELIAYPAAKDVKHFEIPSEVRIIREEALYFNLANLKTIFIPSSVMSVERFAVADNVQIYTERAEIPSEWYLSYEQKGKVTFGVTPEQYQSIVENFENTNDNTDVAE